MKDFLKLNLAFLLFAALFLTACGNDDDPDPKAPDTYAAFENVSYSGQTDRLNMLKELTAAMKEGNSGTAVSEQKLLDMYANANSPFSFTSDRDLKSKTFATDQAQFESWMSAHAAISGSSAAGSNGTAGILTSADGTKSYLVNANGKEYIQLVEKGLFGACCYYQIAEVYTRPDKVGPAVDNETVVPGEGTARQHHWDEAFGYLGIPEDFPGNTTGLYGIGNYCNGRDAVLGLNSTLITPFINGRFAIDQDDDAGVVSAADEARQAVELVFVATGIHYINSALDKLTDDALRCHALSEAEAFIWSLKFNSDKKISDADWANVLDLLGDNFYTVSQTDLQSARDVLVAAYGIDASIASQL